MSCPSLLAIGRRRRVGRGDEEVDLAVLELGVQGLLIEQLRGLGFEKDPRTAVINEGITGCRLGHKHELDPLVARGDAQSGAPGGLGILGHGWQTLWAWSVRVSKVAPV